MGGIRDEDSTALLGMIENQANEIADYLVKSAALWQVNSDYDRGYVAAHHGIVDVLRARALAAAERVGELRAEETARTARTTARS